jgi:hypothetical protein
MEALEEELAALWARYEKEVGELEAEADRLDALYDGVASTADRANRRVLAEARKKYAVPPAPSLPGVMAGPLSHNRGCDSSLSTVDKKHTRRSTASSWREAKRASLL